MDLRRWIERSLFEWDDRWTDIAQSVGLSVAGLTLATACNVGLDWADMGQRTLRISGTLGAASLCLSGARQARELARLSTLYETRQKFRIEAAKAVYAQEVKNLANPAFSPEAVKLTPFDWQSLRDTVEYPHIAITGKTGQGKSTLAEYLCTLLGGTVIAVAPHYEPGDFPSADLIAGAGRDYGKAVTAEALVDWADILAGQVVSVSGLIKSLHQEMTERYRGDRSQCQPVNVILDEFNAYAKVDGLGDLIKELVRESRKVGIRLILLCHGTEVKSLGIEGEGSLRQSLTQIRLGNFAKDHAEMKKNKCKLHSPDYLVWAATCDYFKTTNRPALVEDDLGIIPMIKPGDIPKNPNQRILGCAQPDAHSTPQKNSVQFLEACLQAPCTQPAHNAQRCAKCGSENVRTSGTTSKGKQRWRCNDCGKTWS